MSGNVRFILSNLADASASLTPTSAAGSLVAANLLVDERDLVWRSTSLAAQTLDIRWSATQSIDSICLAWTNLTSSATIEAKGYATAGDVSTVFDVTVSPDTALDIGNTTVQIWVPTPGSVKQIKIVITDASNPDGYVEASRLVIGLRIAPATNPSRQGFSIGFMEQRKPERTESYDLTIEPGRRCRRMTLPLDFLETTSRDEIVALIANGLGSGVWVSAFPEDTTASTRQLHAFWGALVSEVDLRYPMFDTWAGALVFEEMG